MKAEGRRQKAEKQKPGRKRRCSAGRLAIGNWPLAIQAKGSPRRANRQFANRQWPTWLVRLVLFLLLAGVALAEQRFPPPDFESGHKLPATDDARRRGRSLPVSRCGGARRLPRAGKLAGL